jgi:hypothetical protein
MVLVVTKLPVLGFNGKNKSKKLHKPAWGINIFKEVGKFDGRTTNTRV